MKLFKTTDGILSNASVALGREADLDLGQVAPALLQLGATAVPMPGQRASASGVPPGGAEVTVVGVAPAVTILRTKTRPKKLALLGSDGNSYTFLLKAPPPLPFSPAPAQHTLATTWL